MPLGTWPDCPKAVAQTAKVRLTWAGPDGARAQNVLYVQLESADSPSSSTVLTAIAQSAANAVTHTGSLLSVMCNTWEFLQVDAEDNSGITGTKVFLSMGVAGAISAEAVPPSSAWVASWGNAGFYRGGHPRTYFPGMPAGNLDTPGGRLISGTFRATLQAAAFVFFENVANASTGWSGGTPGFIHAAEARACLTPPVFLSWDSVLVRQRLCSQRRRLGKLV